MRNDDLVLMGYVRGAFGVRGWVKIHADTEFADSLFQYPVWWLGRDGQWSSYRFEEGAVQPKALMAKLAGVDTREAAEAMRGMQIAISRSEFPDTDDDEYYWSDLIGLDVVNKDGQRFGQVAELMETGANEVLVVREGKSEWLIPFVGQFVLDVSLADKRITVDWNLDD
ncbi:ribosome maturation factor RimM [Pseudogulbenkiania subflava]|uniref:Ribosome maturation factor RimM n=1 Tax=Pseudogulbenkiania subflava DSM 22618 TaxID=1123014 RepID=A0A1Y6B7I5_9NEIS|nr:ribosome maturation factor RimM [Pseudogulbenkiania subflava]SME97022.1 16S rRNA processing protein RimM [Pseudogulbenkiania subflava DSM 22618]